MLEFIADVLPGGPHLLPSQCGITLGSGSDFQEMQDNRWRRRFQAEQACKRQEHEHHMARLRPPAKHQNPTSQNPKGR
jgi:hypothetical protein